MNGLGRYGWAGFALFLIVGSFLVYKNPQLGESFGATRPGQVAAGSTAGPTNPFGGPFPSTGASGSGLPTSAASGAGSTAGGFPVGAGSTGGTGATLRIGTFNLRAYGETKASRLETLRALGYLISLFDVCAVQEIRSLNRGAVDQLLASVNQASQQFGGGGAFQVVLGPRLGRSASKEQYAYFYNTRAVLCDTQQVYTVHDPQDLLHREPLVAWFRARTVDPRQAFTFTLATVHTDPDEADREVSVLDDVVRIVRADGRGEDDVILLGDLNVDYAHLGDLGPMRGFGDVLDRQPTNTLGTKQYDHILFEKARTAEYLGPGGPVDFVKLMNLPPDQAMLISDHLPVGGTFSAYEADRFAAGGGFPVR